MLFFNGLDFGVVLSLILEVYLVDEKFFKINGIEFNGYVFDIEVLFIVVESSLEIDVLFVFVNFLVMVVILIIF